jgi:hypothetical protein
MERVQRYGSKRLLSAVSSAVARAPRPITARAEPAVIAYLLRVSPDAGVRRLGRLLGQAGDSRSRDAGSSNASAEADLRTHDRDARTSGANVAAGLSAQDRDARSSAVAAAVGLRASDRYARAPGDAMAWSHLRDAGDADEMSLLSEVAVRRVSAPLERVAMGRLADGDPAVAIDAAEVLGRFGAAPAKEALLARLASWRVQWEPQRAQLEGMRRDDALAWQGQLERALMTSIVEGLGWYTDGGEIARLGGQCLSAPCRDYVDSYQRSRAERDGTLTTMMTRAELEGTVDVRFTLLQYAGLSRAELARKLRQLPSDTVLRWRLWAIFASRELWPPEEQAALLDDIDALVQSAGLRLRRDDAAP